VGRAWHSRFFPAREDNAEQWYKEQDVSDAGKPPTRPQDEARDSASVQMGAKAGDESAGICFSRLDTQGPQCTFGTSGVAADGDMPLGEWDRIVAHYGGDRSALIQILLDVQREHHWLSAACLAHLSARLQVPLARVYQVATFYKAFSLVPRGRHTVCVCLGTACHVRRAPMLLGRVSRKLDLQPGQTTADRRFTLLTVNCMGCCALGPVLSVDNAYYSNPTNTELDAILGACA
jgi:NADH-quinone oxidoreductase subunit E